MPQKTTLAAYFVPTGAWTPKCKFDDFMKSDGSMDCHMWCQGPDGTIYDYTDEQILAPPLCGTYATNSIVRKEFPPQLQQAVFAQARRTYKGASSATRSRAMQNFGYCTHRALNLKKEHPELTLVAGSLGFVQPDGRTWYEFG